jgi:hypothetical protein
MSILIFNLICIYYWFKVSLIYIFLSLSFHFFLSQFFSFFNFQQVGSPWIIEKKNKYVKKWIQPIMVFLAHVLVNFMPTFS